jgi:hypothetical protein
MTYHERKRVELNDTLERCMQQKEENKKLLSSENNTGHLLVSARPQQFFIKIGMIYYMNCYEC